MRVCAVALVVAVLCVRSFADSGEIGVVSSGDKQVAAHVEKWLKKQGHTLVATPLSKDAANTLANCFVLDDLKCARGVVDARTKAISLVYVGVDVDGKNMTLTVYWFVKGRDPIGEKQTCDACADDKWRAVVDAILQRLSQTASVAMGKLALESEPAGLTALLDDVKIGPTPLEREVPTGKHTITLTHHGKSVASREIEIETGETNSVSITADLDRKEPGSKFLAPAVLLAAGVVSATAGGIMVWKGSQDDATMKWIYPALVPGGIALCVVGGGAAIGGGILLLRAGLTKSAPVVAAGPDGAYLGWVSRF